MTSHRVAPLRPPYDPWTAALYGPDPTRPPLGSGVLIDPWRLLTCDHVVARYRASPAELTVVFRKAGIVPTVRIPAARISEHSPEADVALVHLALPVAVPPAPLACAEPPSLLGENWWAFGFPHQSPNGNDAHGTVGAILADGHIRLDTESRYVVAPGFSGTGLWSFQHQAVVALVGGAQAGGPHPGDAMAITLRHVSLALPDLVLPTAERVLEEDSRPARRSPARRPDVSGVSGWRAKYLTRVVDSLNRYLDDVVRLPVRDTSLPLLERPGLMWQRSELAGKRPAPLPRLPRGFGPLPVASPTAAYERSPGNLVVLGGAGSGKTVALHVLARDLAVAALSDREAALPILISAASWPARDHPAVERWVLDEVPLLRDRLRQLTETGRFVLLLDGLDEVPARTEGPGHAPENPRADLISGLSVVPQLVVACRTDQYESIAQNLAISDVFVLDELSEQAVLWYASAVPAIAMLLREDPYLRTVARTPLMLYLLCAMENVADPGYFGHSSIAEATDTIMEAFVRHRFNREQGTTAPGDGQHAVRLDDLYNGLGRLAMADAGGGGNRNLYTTGQILAALRTRDAYELAHRMNLLLVGGSQERFLHAKLRDHFAFRFARHAIQSPSASERDSAAWALWQVPDQRAVDVLLPALDDVDPYVRGSAASALGRIGDPRALPLLRRMRSDRTPVVSMYGSTLAEVAQRAIEAIGRRDE